MSAWPRALAGALTPRSSSDAKKLLACSTIKRTRACSRARDQTRGAARGERPARIAGVARGHAHAVPVGREGIAFPLGQRSRTRSGTRHLESTRRARASCHARRSARSSRLTRCAGFRRSRASRANGSSSASRRAPNSSRLLAPFAGAGLALTRRDSRGARKNSTASASSDGRAPTHCRGRTTPRRTPPPRSSRSPRCRSRAGASRRAAARGRARPRRSPCCCRTSRPLALQRNTGLVLVPADLQSSAIAPAVASSAARVSRSPRRADRGFTRAAAASDDADRAVVVVRHAPRLAHAVLVARLHEAAT